MNEEAESAPGEKLLSKVNEKQEIVASERPLEIEEVVEPEEVEEVEENDNITENIKRAPLAENEFKSQYDELDNKQFRFSSGAGAWATSFIFEEDGKFSGSYYDADHLERVESRFEGQFIIREQIDEYTYLLTLEEFEITSETGKEEMDGGIHVTNVGSAHGFQDGSYEFELYLPYKPKNEVSDMYLSWVYGQATNDYDFLNTFGLYNVNHEFGMEEIIN